MQNQSKTLEVLVPEGRSTSTNHVYQGSNSTNPIENLWIVGRAGFEPATSAVLAKTNRDPSLEAFSDFLRISLGRSRRTIRDYRIRLRVLARTVGKELSKVTEDDIHRFLKDLKERTGPSNYASYVKAFKAYYRDYLGRYAMNYRYPRYYPSLKRSPTKAELQAFYRSLKTSRMKAIFLTTATSGLRIGEVLSLRMGDVDFGVRSLVPRNHEGETKRSWASFFNAEAEEALRTWLSEKEGSARTRGEKVFPIGSSEFKNEWKQARKESGIDLRPKDLRLFFCVEMGRLGVPDRFVNALCGRVPRSVLFEHYSDFTLENLKRIYERAGLRILS